MPIHYRIDHSLGAVFTTASGTISEEELLDHMNRLSADHGLAPTCVELVDLSRVEQVKASSGSIEKAAEFRRSYGEKTRVTKTAIVATSDYIFGLARMYEILAEETNHTTRVFRDMSQAKEWLGIEQSAPPDGP